VPRALPHRGAARAAFPFVLLPLFWFRYQQQRQR
jgi:hypothetical protein